MAVIQGMCARIAMVTGEGLAATMRKRLPPPLAYALAVARDRRQHVQRRRRPRRHGRRGASGRADPRRCAGLFLRHRVDRRADVALLQDDRADLQMADALALRLRHHGLRRASAVAARIDALRDSAACISTATWLSTMVGVLGHDDHAVSLLLASIAMVEEEKKAGNTTVSHRRGTDARAPCQTCTPTSTPA